MKTIDDVIRHYSKEDKLIETAVFNQVSECCHKEITVKHVVEFPLGGSSWGIPTKHDVCEGCGLEASPVDQCGGCGVVGCSGNCIVDISEGEE